MSQVPLPRGQVPLPRGWSRTTRLLIAIVVAIAVTAAVTVVVTTTGRDEAPTAVPDAASAFGDDASLGRTVIWAAFSPSGRGVLVRTPAGIGIATGRDDAPGEDVAFLTPPGSRAVDAAWFPGETAVLIAEGPVPTGQLAVVELDGTVRGQIPLEPSFGVGNGHGMAIAPDGRRAVVTAEQRETIGGARHLHLVLVDLETGGVTELTPADGADEAGPVFLSDARVAYTETALTADGVSRPMVFELAGGTSAPIAGADEGARVVGVVDGQPAYASRGDIWVGSGDGRRRLLAIDGDVLAVHPQGDLVVASRRGRARIVRVESRT